MATWFDLPHEVKQMILSYIPESDALVYIPRDKRYKKDDHYHNAHHFHNLLLVSKQFVTPQELALALLTSSKLRFYKTNDVRRLCAEVGGTFKERVLQLHLVRLRTASDDPICCYKESLDTLNVEGMLNHFPRLRKVFVSMPEWCLGVWRSDQDLANAGPHENWATSLLDQMFYSVTPYGSGTHDRTKASLAAAAFVGDRKTSNAGRFMKFTKPHAWLRRLIRLAESRDIEIIFQIQLCVAVKFDSPPEAITSMQEWSSDYCFSVYPEPTWYYSYDHDFWYRQHHLAEMSTKDWMLRAEHHEKSYQCHQKLAYDMLHVDGHRSAKWWQELLQDIRHNRWI